MADTCAICGAQGWDDSYTPTREGIKVCHGCRRARELTEEQVRSMSFREVRTMPTLAEALASMPVTTTDLAQPYSVVSPVFTQVSNKGIFSSDFSRLAKQYRDAFSESGHSNDYATKRVDWGFLYGEWSAGQKGWSLAFYICVEELKKKARSMGSDAIVGLKMDLDLDAKDLQFFYMQMYGTAVKLG